MSHLRGTLLLLLACPFILATTGIAQPPPGKSQYIRNLTMTSKFSPVDFSADGNLSKSVWRDAPRFRFDTERMGRYRFPDSETQVASLWTPTFVYFAFWCKYRTLNIYEADDSAKERWELWNRDVIEAFINPQPERFLHYYELEVGPNNQWIDLEIDLTKTPMNDAGWNSGFQHATRVDAVHKVWMVEMCIPVKSMGVNGVQPGDEWRLNLYRADGPGDDTKRRFMAWSQLPAGTSTSFHQPASFGIIKFEK